MYPLAVAGAAWAGAQGVVWAQAVANILAGAVAAWLAWRFIRGLNRPATPAGAVPRAAE
jgi:membrane protein implicated in regulation of membrane protease activity